MKIIFQILGTSIMLFALGCSKGGDSTTTPTTPTVSAKTTLLTSSAWSLISLQHKLPSSTNWIEDIPPNQAACVADNKVVFRTNGTYETNEGATKCNPNDPQILESGTWSFTTNETVLVTQASNGTIIYTASLDGLTSTSLLISFTKANSNNVIEQYKYSFSH